MKQGWRWFTSGKIAFLTAVFYLLLTALMLIRAPDLQPQLSSFTDRFFLFIHPGSQWDTKTTRPFNIEYTGYDGQFFYDLAHHPLQPDTTLDKPAYRTARILYPLLAKLLSLGQANFLPITLMLVNFIAIALATFILALTLVKLKQSPMWAFGYAFWPGTICAYLYDLSEPLCFLFILAALWLQFCTITEKKFASDLSQPIGYVKAKTLAHNSRFGYWQKQTVWVIGLLLLLASLSKELALLFGVGWLLYYLARNEWANVGRLGISWLLPFAIWQGILRWHFGKDGLSAGEPFSWFPFGGFFSAGKLYQPPLLEQLSIVATTGIPIIWIGLLLLQRISFGKNLLGLIKFCQTNPLSFMLITHVAFLLFLPAATYIYLVDHARNATGLIILLYLLPASYFKLLRLYLISISLLLSSVVVITFAITGNAFLIYFLN